MPDLFEGDTPESEFELPGDDQVMERLVENSQDPEVQEMVAEQPRDERGRFATAEQDQQQPEQEELAPDDPVASRLAEKEAMIGRQSSEIGELREQQRQWQEWYAAQQQPQAVPAGDWETLISEDPAYATQLAAQQGDEYHYQQAWREWQDVSPGAPQLWHQQQQIAQQQQVTMGALQHYARERHQQDTGQAVAALAERYPDLPDRIDEMAKIAPEYPFVMRAFASGDPSEVAKAVETLYLNTRGLATDTLAQTAQETVRKLAEDEQRAAHGAAVVTTTRTNREPTASLADAIAAEWPDDDPLKSGWNLG